MLREMETKSTRTDEKTVTTIRLSRGDLAWLKSVAASHERTVSAQIRFYLAQIRYGTTPFAAQEQDQAA